MNTEYENQPIPRLSQEIKSLNGKSSRKLQQSISQLDDILDDKKPRLESHDEDIIIPRRKIS